MTFKPWWLVSFPRATDVRMAVLSRQYDQLIVKGIALLRWPPGVTVILAQPGE